jgi:hypothetical protein
MGASESALLNFLSTNREKLAPFASSLLFIDWAEVALGEGMDPEDVFYRVFAYNLNGSANK